MDKKEMVKHPAHYNFGNYEPVKVIMDWKLNFNLGNVVKYVARAGRKGDALEDLKKARQYLDFEIEAMQGNNLNFTYDREAFYQAYIDTLHQQIKELEAKLEEGYGKR